MNAFENSEQVVLAELALAICSAIVASGLAGLIDDSPRGILVAVALGTHLLAAVLRRVGLGIGTSLLLMVAGGIAAATAGWYGSTATAGIVPTGATWTALDLDITGAWASFSERAAPVPFSTGLVVAAAVGVFIAACLADWAAFRVASPAEALVPAATLFAFTSVLDRQDFSERVIPAVLTVGSALLFVLAHRQARGIGTSNWLGTKQAGTQALGLAGLGLVVGATASAAAITPVLPWSDADPVIEWNDDAGDDPRQVISPLVDIQSRLLDLGPEEMMQVRTTNPSYIRLTSLSDFNGRIWNIPEQKFPPIDDVLSLDAAGAPAEAHSFYDFTVGELNQAWAPAVYEPASVTNSSIGLSYHRESAALIGKPKFSNGATYTIDAVLPTHDPAALRAAPLTPAGEFFDTHTDLPSDFPGSVAEMARTQTAGQTNKYDQLFALQQWFNSFTYDINVDNGHGSSALESFLELRAGYCEQFSAAFAAMARSLGYPARVVVGFTQGELIEPGLYSVKGLNAHAWPEVYFEGIGWVDFEPTPGRGNPNSEDHTGVTAQQASADDPNAAEPTPTSTTVATTATSVPGQPAPTTAPPLAEAPPAAPGAASAAPGTGWSTPTWLKWVGVLVLAFAAYAAVVVGIPALRERRRVAAATSPGGVVALKWKQSIDRLAQMGVTPRSHETAEEFSIRARSVHPPLAEPIRTLTAGHALTTYSGGEPSSESVDSVTQSAQQIRKFVDEQLGVLGRARVALDPRRVLRA